MKPTIILNLICPFCRFEGTPLAHLNRNGFDGHDAFCGAVDCVSCGETFPVEITTIHEVQHACLVALGEN